MPSIIATSTTCCARCVCLVLPLAAVVRADRHGQSVPDLIFPLLQALDNLLIKQVSENIQRRLSMIGNLSQLAQIVVNVLFFQTACSDLETLLVTLRCVLSLSVSS